MLKDSNIEDFDLAKVAGKALHNMMSETNYWTQEIINKLDEVLDYLGKEMDYIMVSSVH